MKPTFVLNPADVAESEFGSTAGQGRGGRMTRTSRAIGLTGVRVELLHKPTGVVVSAEVPQGHYSRQELINRRKALKTQLWAELEKKVIAFLRLSG